MAPNRYGDDLPPRDSPVWVCTAGLNCRRGWLTPPDSDSPQLCPCRLADRPTHDREPVISERARLAIEAAERNDL